MGNGSRGVGKRNQTALLTSVGPGPAITCVGYRSISRAQPDYQSTVGPSAMLPMLLVMMARIQLGFRLIFVGPPARQFLIKRQHSQLSLLSALHRVCRFMHFAGVRSCHSRYSVIDPSALLGVTSSWGFEDRISRTPQ